MSSRTISLLAVLAQIVFCCYGIPILSPGSVGPSVCSTLSPSGISNLDPSSLLPNASPLQLSLLNQCRESSSNIVLPGSPCGNPYNTYLPGSSLSPNAYATLMASSQPLIESISNAGLLTVSSYSPIAPTGVSITAENLVADGNVVVSGNLPFLGAVNVDGNLPTAGQGAVVYNSAPGVGLTSSGCTDIGGVNLGLNVGLSPANAALLNGVPSSVLNSANLNNLAYNRLGTGLTYNTLVEPCGCK
ncbi:hypothetical protein JYU34_009365 [Plutella xylostella]|uniref:Uncharacterized protein n=1 Tax=Plutella xylostella TaxID=51655 RepID=A0ABQ7QJE5_PLUXY|nr:hypothetical protein JYU34_009365 [Plutella xylostella]